MTFEEAKKILEKEGFVVERFLGVLVEDVKTASWEKIEVSEAMRVVAENGYLALMEESKYKERKARLKKEYEKNTKAPGPGEEQPKEGNPALKESASQFNDALLDEQAKKIKRLGKEIARLNGIIHDKNEEIKRKTKGCCELITENVDLKKKLSDKNAILSDVAEELRLSKIREKNLTEVGQKYMKEVEAQKDLVDDISLKYDGAKYNLKIRIEECEELNKLLADKVGNGIDWKRNADAIKLYVNRASRERLWNPINQDICNEKELSFIINHGGKRVKYALRFDGTDIVYECSDPDKKPRIPTPEISEEELMKLQEKVCADIAEEGADLTGVIIIKSEK